MSKIDDFIDRFFDRIKKKQATRIIKGFEKENPELAKKLSSIQKGYQDLEDYLVKTSKKK